MLPGSAGHAPFLLLCPKCTPWDWTEPGRAEEHWEFGSAWRGARSPSPALQVLGIRGRYGCDSSCLSSASSRAWRDPGLRMGIALTSQTKLARQAGDGWAYGHEHGTGAHGLGSVPARRGAWKPLGGAGYGQIFLGGGVLFIFSSLLLDLRFQNSKLKSQPTVALGLEREAPVDDSFSLPARLG